MSSLAHPTDSIDFETFLKQDGFHLNLPPDDAKVKIQQEFSSDSVQRFENLMTIRKQRPYTSEEFYAVPGTLKEAALLFSPQAHISSACGQHLYRTLLPFLSPGLRVGDMGCGLGSWTRWMAATHPQVGFVGVDKHSGLLSMAQEANERNNCQFVECEYEELSRAYGPFDIVTSLLGVDFEPPPFLPNLEELSALDPTCNAVARYFERAFSPVVAGWRRAATPTAVIMAVLRLSCFEACYGCVAAAKQEGLYFNPELSSCIALGKQRFPLLVFERTERPDPSTLDDLLQWWAERTGASADAQILLDAAALWRYRRLKDKKILESVEEHYEDGHWLRKETGIAAGNVGYVYEYATTLYRRLECLSVDSLQSSSKPIFVATDA